jgi:hypothetical protein
MMPDPAAPLVLVSGLPRSGTSLVMGLLAAGGHPVLTDGLRLPDADNSRGYFEYEPVKSLMRDQRWLYQHRGPAIKIISALLPFIPADLPMKVILIERRLPEVLASQAAMLRRAGRAQPAGPALLAAAFRKQTAATHLLLATRPGTAVLHLHHHELLQEPAIQIERLCAFLPVLGNPEAMLRTIDPALHRQKEELSSDADN